MSNTESASDAPIKADLEGESAVAASVPKEPVEFGGREGPDPVRYGDWEKNGRCIDF